jgi:hypothetical protein
MMLLLLLLLAAACPSDGRASAPIADQAQFSRRPNTLDVADLFGPGRVGFVGDGLTLADGFVFARGIALSHSCCRRISQRFVGIGDANLPMVPTVRGLSISTAVVSVARPPQGSDLVVLPQPLLEPEAISHRELNDAELALC